MPTFANRNNKAYSLKDITNAAIRTLVGTKCLTNAALAIGTTTTKINTVAGAIVYTIDGKLLSKTGAADIMDLTSASVLFFKQSLAANQFTSFLCGFDPSGNPYVLQGPVVSAAADVTLAELTLDTKGVPSFQKPDGTYVNFCPVGYVKIASGASAYVPGTTALTGLGTYVNCSVLPAGDL